jgi:hypothetical protein
MELYQLLTIIGANLLVFIGFMGSVIALHIHGNKQAKTDYRHMEARTNAILKAIQSEMKDFHKRLCVIEERRK